MPDFFRLNPRNRTASVPDDEDSVLAELEQLSDHDLSHSVIVERHEHDWGDEIKVFDADSYRPPSRRGLVDWLFGR